MFYLIKQCNSVLTFYGPPSADRFNAAVAAAAAAEGDDDSTK